MLSTIIHSPAFVGACAGALSAAAVDIHAFRQWHRWYDLMSYSWGLASFRWFQGAVVGAVTGAGYGVLLG